MKCVECNHLMKEVKVKIQDADSLATSYQCGKCGHFDFEDKSIGKVIEEIKAKESPLKIKQKIIKISQDRLGIYLTKDVTRSLHLRAGEEVYVSVPCEKRIIVDVV